MPNVRITHIYPIVLSSSPLGQQVICRDESWHYYKGYFDTGEGTLRVDATTDKELIPKHASSNKGEEELKLVWIPLEIWREEFAHLKWVEEQTGYRTARIWLILVAVMSISIALVCAGDMIPWAVFIFGFMGAVSLNLAAIFTGRMSFGSYTVLTVASIAAYFGTTFGYGYLLIK